MYHRQEHGAAQWPPLLKRKDGTPDIDRHHAIVAFLTDPDRRLSRDGKRRHLLSYGSVASCGVCGSPLRVRTIHGHPTYVCDGIGGCTTRRQDRVDELVAGIVTARLSQPDAADLLLPEQPDNRPLYEEISAKRTQLLLASDAYPATITMEQLGRITSRLTGEIEALQARLRPSMAPADLDAFRALTDAGERARQVWDRLPVVRRQALLEILGVRVRLLPTTPGPVFRLEDVEVTWPSER